jgi:hypothetical protein
MNRIKLGFVVLSTLIVAGCGMPLLEYTEEIKGSPAQETPSSPVGPSVPSGPGEGNGVPLITNYDLQAYVPVPTAGAAVVKVVAGRQDLDASVVWRDAGGNDITGSLTVFEEGAVYQADISLKAKGDYAFDSAASFKYYPVGAVGAQPDDNTDAANRSLSTVTYEQTATPKSIDTKPDLTNSIPKPVTGGTPVMSFSEGTYSGTVAWTITSGLFLPGMDYTATVTLYPAPGYVFPGTVQVIHNDSLSVTDFTGEPRTGIIGFTRTFHTTISSVNLTNSIPKPVAGATPLTYFSTSEYSATVRWNPLHSIFQANTMYTASVFLTPAAGYAFANFQASYSGSSSIIITHEYDLSVYVPVPIRNVILQKNGANTWIDYSTDKWTIKAYWYQRGVNAQYTDGWWTGGVTSFTEDAYGALIILTANEDNPFDEGIDFKYPTYEAGGGEDPLRGYYKFSPTVTLGSYYDWLWQNDGNHRSPPPKYDTAPYALFSYQGYPAFISEVNTGPDKDRKVERFVMVGFNTQADPVVGTPPSGGPVDGLPVAVITFGRTGIPSNLDYGGATFAKAIAMIRAAHGAGYLSLKLDQQTAAGTTKGTSDNPDDSQGGEVTFSAVDPGATSPPHGDHRRREPGGGGRGGCDRPLHYRGERRNPHPAEHHLAGRKP